MKISIFGMGYVGAVSGACLAKLGHQVIGVDTNPKKVELINTGQSPIVEEGISEFVRETVANGSLRATTDAELAVRDSDISFVSVGTPSASNGSLSLAAVEAVSSEIGLALKRKPAMHVVVYRSTLLPGTTEQKLIPLLTQHSGKRPDHDVHVCFNPEFLREGSSIKDFHRPPYTLVGSGSERGFETLAQIYSGIEAPLIRTSVKVAESVKYLSNMYHALKISFANEVGAVLKQAGVDAREAMDLFCQDTVLNVSRAYLRPGYAFGGSCLPKDLRAFVYMARRLDIDIPVLTHIMESNERHIRRAYDMVLSHGKRRIALFGLAFKAGTDDLRESPMVALAERLIGRGYELKVYDPNVNAAALIGANREYIEREIPHFERLLQPDVASTLADAEVVIVAHADRDTAREIAAHMPSAKVVDLQGLGEIAAAAGDNYQGICW
jgi:GDP-mannose 6-dehydrogenase